MMKSSPGVARRWEKVYKSISPQHQLFICVLSSDYPCCPDSEASTGGASLVAVVQNATVLEPSGFIARASATSY